MDKLKYFRCKGSIGIYYGLGVAEIAINFDEISGLVAFAGKNGFGKTTILEMLSPFDSIKSRQIIEGNKYNLKNEFMLRDSFEEVCYIFNGKEYIFRVEIPAGTTMGIEGYITEDGVPLVKGKISEYRKKVEEMFGSEALFYSSLFSCQGGEKLTDKTVGEFKKLLIELLGLNRYEVMWHNCGKAKKAVEIELGKVETELSQFEGKEETVNELKSELESLGKKRTALGVDIDNMKYNITISEKEIKDLEVKKSEAEKRESLIEGKKLQKADINDRIRALKLSHGKELISYSDQRDVLKQDIKQHDALIENEELIMNAAEKISLIEAEKSTANEKLKLINKSIDEKQTQIDEINKERSENSKKIIALNSDEELEVIKKEHEAAKESYRDAIEKQKECKAKLEKANDKSVLNGLMKEIEQLDDSKKLLDVRPQNCTIDDCPFILSAMQAIELKPEKEKAIQAWKDQNKILVADAEKDFEDSVDHIDKVVAGGKAINLKFTERNTFIHNQVELLNNTISALDKIFDETSVMLLATKSDRTELSEKIEGFDSKIKTLQEMASKKSELETSKKLIISLKKSLEEKEVEFSKKEKSFDSLLLDLNSKASIIQKAIDAEALNESSDMIKMVLARKETSLNHAKIDSQTINDSIFDIDKRVAVLEDNLKSNDDGIKKMEVLKIREKFIRKEIKKWDYIRAAVSKSGLQALEIASAAPLLTKVANDLLHSAFGGEFYLDLVTLDPEGKEILDIQVTREDGESFMLSKFSGGEKTWILQAFKASQIYVKTEKSGIQFPVAFCDEESSALDKDKSERFIAMYRSLMKMCGFEKLIYISHLEDCQALADHVINFQDGGLVSESNI